MAATSEKNVYDFLRKELCGKGIAKLILRHAGKGSKGDPVETFEIIESIPFDQIVVMKDLVMSTAQTDADGMGPSVQRYALTSYVKDKDDNETQSARVVFRLRGETEEFDDESGEEAPTPKGLLSQLMRHNEANNRTLVGAIGQVFGRMSQRMDSQDRLVEKLLEDRQSMFETLEGARSHQHERQLELQSAEGDERRKDKAFDKIAMLIPAILNKISGGAIPSKTDPVMMMMNELVSSMSVEQFGHIRASLQPEQAILFMQVLQAFQKSKEQEQKALTNGVSEKTVS